ncbi:hypothetical protein Fcan01_26436 [Folsomia candida]|uniref:DUF4246 domain-containing protein n=1 Tax=Folsomia candida TaxID=158441 RepID=A0A226D3P4_FOLCA|nr:hypothetical protein Fcan01_26436 [Folsomia candida]
MTNTTRAPVGGGPRGDNPADPDYSSLQQDTLAVPGKYVSSFFPLVAGTILQSSWQHDNKEWVHGCRNTADFPRLEDSENGGMGDWRCATTVVDKGWLADAKKKVVPAVATRSSGIWLDTDWPMVVARLASHVTGTDGQIAQSLTEGCWVVVKDDLMKSLGALGAECVARKDRNWEEYNSVLRVVDPYRHCAILDRSNIEQSPFIPKAQQWEQWNSNFQLLPADVTISWDGSAHFTSYVNELNPAEHGELYAVLEQVMSAFVPLFEKLLTEMGSAAEADPISEDLKSQAYAGQGSETVREPSCRHYPSDP